MLVKNSVNMDRHKHCTSLNLLQVDIFNVIWWVSTYRKVDSCTILDILPAPYRNERMHNEHFVIVCSPRRPLSSKKTMPLIDIPILAVYKIFVT